MPPRPAPRQSAVTADDAQRRDLYFFSLYRCFEAALLALLLFTPASGLIGNPTHPWLAKGTVVLYLIAAAWLLYSCSKVDRETLRTQVLTGTSIDIVVATLAMHALPQGAPGIALMLLFNIGAAALMVPLRYGLGGAGLAAMAMIGEFVWTVLSGIGTPRPLAERLMFAVSYLAIAMLTYLLGRQMRESQALAERRGAEVADLAELNELIIRRMRTGVLLVDEDGGIRLANEASRALLGDIEGDRNLRLVSPQLAARLRQWLYSGEHDETPLRLGGDQADILPRFVRLHANSDEVLVFLDDTSLLSRRAESMTLATLGRFSASLAHEIRNPLAAISYATQLLQESGEINDSDRHLLQIVHQQCQRTNGIVESVLGLARRERANPEPIDLVAFARRFVIEYQAVMTPDAGTLQASGGPGAVVAMADPRHLQQVLTVLVHNAFTYGHLPEQPARVTVTAHQVDGRPAIDVLDRGPGIAAGNLAQLFRPFFTTSEHGTGLGLYIASELCRANDADLDYVEVPAGGGCFRIVLPAPHALLPREGRPG